MPYFVPWSSGYTYYALTASNVSAASASSIEALYVQTEPGSFAVPHVAPVFLRTKTLTTSVTTVSSDASTITGNTQQQIRPSCPAHLEATHSLQKRPRARHRRNVHIQGPPTLDNGVGNWPTLLTSNRFAILASLCICSKGPVQVPSPHGYRSLRNSRSRRPNTRALLPDSPVRKLQPL